MAKKTHYIYSTLSSSMHYENHVPGGGDLPQVASSVFIQGGANIPDKFLRTPDGAVITPVSDEELTALEANEIFQLHKANGFIVVSDKKHDAEAVAADMTTRDASAPLVDSDFVEGQQPVTAKADEDTRSQAPKPSGRRA